MSVLVFASYAEALGGREVAVSVALPCEARAVVDAVRALPGGGRLPREPLVAVNQVWVPLTHPVHAGDEIAVIPPVAGG